MPILRMLVTALWLFIVLFVAALLGGLIHSSVAEEKCFTLAEARKVYLDAHLYWHGKGHCWDNRRGGRQHIDAPPAPADTQPLPPERPATVATPSEPSPTIMFPSLQVADAGGANGMIVAENITRWPLIIDLDQNEPPDSVVADSQVFNEIDAQADDMPAPPKSTPPPQPKKNHHVTQVILIGVLEITFIAVLVLIVFGEIVSTRTRTRA